MTLDHDFNSNFPKHVYPIRKGEAIEISIFYIVGFTIENHKSKMFIFLTNHFDIDANTIAGLYKERWKIKLFFRWIKQHLKIKSFYSTSENAIHCQIWIAICTYLLVAISKKKLKIGLHFDFTNLREVSISHLRKMLHISAVCEKQFQFVTPVTQNM